MIERERYEENVGRPPRNLPDGHPDRWQWGYTGTREERESLLDRLAGSPHADSPQEETLW